uniref:Clathrin_bdg domain-containing protein n=1 Tax=Anopheles epiroticus TaxID=199890 RepID=A0A182PEG8_9DIPT
MSSQIPPLVCHTPPPIDFDADDDDDDYGSDIPEDDVIGLDERNGADCPDDEFGDFATVLPGATNLEPIPTEAVIDNETETLTTSIPVAAETKGIFPPRLGSDSPPSLILPPNDYTETGDDETAGDGIAGDDDEDDEDIDFQPFGSPSQPPEPPPEDSISLPSLHFDADVSKSEEDDNVPAHQQQQPPNATSATSSVSGIETEVDLPVAAAAERTTPVIQECSRFDDNTENDFTDFTTASNERSSVVLEVPTANDVSFELDDFAQLESTPSADSNFVSQQSRADFATFDADFSKFDSFQASFPATIDDAVPVKTPVEESKSMPIVEQTPIKQTANETSQPLEDDFDDFQEFATFSGQPAVVVSAQPSPDAEKRESTSIESSTSTVENESKDNDVQRASSNDGNALNEAQHVGDKDEDDDDDFGEFSDFKQPEAITIPSSLPTPPPISTFSMESVQKLLEAMFPAFASESLGTDTGQQQVVVSDNIPNSKLHTQLQDFDNTNALAYQYGKSSSSKTLVTALGIDSRNIMYGPKWNSSMPRFAANLSFNPLEPLKPIAASAGKETNSEKNAISQPANKTTPSMAMSIGLDPLQVNAAGHTSVPAAQFDWNSSGLVNPLEGVQEMLQKATTGQPEDGPKGEVLDTQIAENAGPAAADDIAVKAVPLSSNSAVASTHPAEFEDIRSLDFNPTGSSNGSNNSSHTAQYSLTPMANEQQQVPEQIEAVQPHPFVQPPMSISSSSSPNSVPVVRTIKLPETHIFTPSRGVTPISRDITDRDIVVREYHDVEYSLEKSTANPKKEETEFDEFNDFQSVPVAAISMIGTARPVIGRSPTEELERYRQEPVGQPSGTSAAEIGIEDGNDEDDEFSDFQAAAPPMATTVPPVNKSVSTVQNNNRSITSSPVMLLSPAILLPQQANTMMEREDSPRKLTTPAGSINWPDPGIDPDELERFEAAFAKPSAASAPVSATPTVASNQSLPSIPKAATAQVEEDEWTDFISSKPATVKEAGKQPPTSTSAGAGPTSSETGVQEEWTDFISSSTATVGGYAPHSRLSSSHNNFNYPRPSLAGGVAKGGTNSSSSWSNQPQLPPPQFSSWNSNSLYYNPMASLPLTGQQQPSQYVPHHQQPSFYSRSDMAYTGGGSYSGGSPKVPTSTQQYPHLHTGMTMMGGQQQSQHQPPMQLLPELSFITPNATGHGGAAGTPGAGTKPAAHSFLSNVISSNSFTKK